MSTVNLKKHKNGEVWSIEELEEMKRLRFEERKSLQEIADMVGISRQRVHQLIGDYSWFRARKN